MQINNNNNYICDLTEDNELEFILALSKKESEKEVEGKEEETSSDEELQKVLELSQKIFEEEQKTHKRKREDDNDSKGEEKKVKVETTNRAQEIINELKNAPWRSKKINLLEKAALGIAAGTAPGFLKSTTSPEDRKVVGNLKKYNISKTNTIGELCDLGITVINENYSEEVRADKLAYLKLAAATYSAHGLTETIKILKK